MPLYEYECLKCGDRYERIQKFSDPPLTECEKCGGQLERLVSAPTIQFKGSGWYVSDYAKKSVAPADSSPAAVSGAAEGKDRPAEKATQKTAGTSDHKKPS